MLKNFLMDENGASLIEYALIAALISIVAIAVMTQVGERLINTFTRVRDALPA